MTYPRNVKSYWESRFPDLAGKWTHWKLTGDGQPIACFAGDKLGDALRFVEVNCMFYSSIKCQRAIAGADGECSDVDELVVEISNIRKQQLP